MASPRPISRRNVPVEIYSEPLFAASPSDGTLRPHTAPERLMGAPGQWNTLGGRGGPGGGAAGSAGGRGEYQRRAARSRNGGLIGGVWSSGGRRRGRAGTGRIGGGIPSAPLSPSSGVNAWWQNETAHQWSGNGGGAVARYPKPHEFLRRSHPTATTATYARSRPAAQHGSTSTLPRTGGWSRAGGRDCVAKAAAAATTGAAADGGGGVDEFWPRTQILGMNAGRLPRQVRQVPVDRPLTAPCGKVGRGRVRTRGMATRS